MTKRWKAVPAAEAQKHPLYGVAGWLLVFSISLALGLVSDIGRLKSEAYSVGMTLGEFFSIDHVAVSYAKFVLGSHTLIVAVIYWFLLSKHPSFRNAASILIASTLPVQVLIGAIFPFSGVGNVLAQQGIIWILSCAVWITYLQRSRRVRVTFENRIDVDTPVVSFSNDQGPVVIPESSQRSDTHRVHAEVDGSISQSINQAGTPSENFWTVAFEELESASRRQGLWARSFSEAGGDDAVAKAKYLAVRASELEKEYRQSKIKLLEEEDRKRQHEEFLKLTDEERAYALLPKGTCPNCDALILLTSSVCPKCKAMFGSGSAWQVIPK
jgi:hypothetical protein